MIGFRVNKPLFPFFARAPANHLPANCWQLQRKMRFRDCFTIVAWTIPRTTGNRGQPPRRLEFAFWILVEPILFQRLRDRWGIGRFLLMSRPRLRQPLFWPVGLPSCWSHFRYILIQPYFRDCPICHRSHRRWTLASHQPQRGGIHGEVPPLIGV